MLLVNFPTVVLIKVILSLSIVRPVAHLIKEYYVFKMKFTLETVAPDVEVCLVSDVLLTPEGKGLMYLSTNRNVYRLPKSLSLSQGYEDWLRHKADNAINQCPVQVVQHGKVVRKQSRKLQVCVTLLRRSHTAHFEVIHYACSQMSDTSIRHECWQLCSKTSRREMPGQVILNARQTPSVDTWL